MNLNQPQFVFLMRNLHVTEFQHKDDFMIAVIAPGVNLVHNSKDNTVVMNINDRSYELTSLRSNIDEIGSILLNYESTNGEERSFTRAVPHLEKYASDQKLPLSMKR